jgi:hypothetical protein
VRGSSEGLSAKRPLTQSVMLKDLAALSLKGRGHNNERPGI